MNKGSRLITQGEKETLVRTIKKRMDNFSKRTLGGKGLRLTSGGKTRSRKGRGSIGIPFFGR